MEDKNIHVKVEGPHTTLTILEGSALEQMPPEKISLSGDIKTIGNFLRVRKTDGAGCQVIDKSKAVVVVDKIKRTIKLLLDPENHYGAIVTGTLELSPELKPFCINGTTTFTKTELVKLFKFNKLFFAKAEKHADLVKAFERIESTVNISASDTKDDRGNKEAQFKKTVQTNAPTEFILSIPVFKGFSESTFRVDIALDVTEGSVRFWFESVELHELMQKRVDEIFDEELKEAAGFVIINQ